MLKVLIGIVFSSLGYSDTQSLSLNENLLAIQSRFRSYQESGLYPPNRRVDAQRLINRKDWANALALKHQPPEAYYGYQTIASWFEGRDFVNQNFNVAEINTETLQYIHQLVHRNEFYWGYEYRRVLSQASSHQVKPQIAQQFLWQMEKPVLRRFFSQYIQFTDVPHSTLAGTLRTDSVDELWVFGTEVITLPQSEYLAYKRLDEYFRVEDVSQPNGPSIPDATVQAKVYFKPHVDMKDRLDQIFIRVRNSLNHPDGKLIDQVKAIVRMQQDLIRNHPFLDGNGRTIRLMADLLFLRVGLCPTHFPNEEDLIVSEDRLVEEAAASMSDYLDQLGQEKLNVQ